MLAGDILRELGVLKEKVSGVNIIVILLGVQAF